MNRLSKGPGKIAAVVPMDGTISSKSKLNRELPISVHTNKPGSVCRQKGEICSSLLKLAASTNAASVYQS